MPLRTDDDSAAPQSRSRRGLRPFLPALGLFGLAGAGALALDGYGPACTVSLALGPALGLAWLEILRLRRITRAHALAMIGAHDGMWEWDPVSKKLQVGRRLLSILGYAEDFLTDTGHWMDLVHPDDRAAYNEAVASHLKGEQPHFYHEYRVRANDGEYRWLAARGIALRDRHGVARLMAGSITDIHARRADEARIRFLAHHDVLTGLPNRVRLIEQVPRMIARAAAKEALLAVLFIDLDRFKTINDSMGHSVGDQLLKAVAQRIADALRPQDMVFRHGGDEFIVILPEVAQAEDAGQVGTRVLEAITQPVQEAGLQLHTSATIGIALYPEDGRDTEALLKNADTAMYAAKSAGGGLCNFFSGAMNDRLQWRVSLETALRGAIEGGELALHYQPQVELASGRVSGAEALLRWLHEGRMIAPDQFIPVAEECGLIHSLGEWVLDTAIAQAAAWQASFPQAPRVAINLSARQFWRRGLADGILGRLREHRLAPETIELEVTESVLIHPDGTAVTELHRLRKEGLHLALDDFGTGYSSLSYLRTLPINQLKVDKSFIFPLAGERSADSPLSAAAIVRAIITMAHGLSISVVAEGVESHAHLDLLQEMGCDHYQGYLKSRPLPAGDFAERFLAPG